MTDSFQRIEAMILRYLYLHKRSVSRTLELVFWPVMELLLWGFVTLYIRSVANDSLADIITFLISALIFWDLLYRSQQGVSISVMEDIWTQNIMNLLISPLRIWEWFAATFLYGMAKTLLISALLTVLALIFYHFNLIEAVGLYLIPFFFNLLFFGWTLGIITSALVIRWGHAVEALIWGIPFLIQPISAIFYPLSVLPEWLQGISRCLPSTYVFEGMREVIQTGEMGTQFVINALLFNILYFFVSCLFFASMFRWSRQTGRLARLGMD